MGRVFKPWYYNARRERVRVADWYAEWQGADGKTHRKKVGRKRHEAEAFLVKMQDAAARQRAGLDPAPGADARIAPLDELKREYLEVLAARDTKPRYREQVADHLGKILRGCGWLVWTDIRADDLVRFLGRRRQPGKDCRGRALKGAGPATLNGYLRTAKGFANWLADRLDAKNPLRKIKPFPEEVDRRRSKRILTDPELAALIAAAAACPARAGAGFPGADRAMLYRVAAFTGLRASELASLTPPAFHLDDRPPVVMVAAADAKGKREEPVPLPAHLAELLRPWLAGRDPRRKLWPGRWAEMKLQIYWLARDLKRAGVPGRDARGRTVTFHSLKRRYVVRLIQAGAKVNEVRRLARHRDVRTTLGYYTDEDLADLGKLADKLPPPG